MMKAEKLVLIDGHSILNRAFYGVPELSNGKGLHTNAVYGFLNIMFKILEEEKPDYLAVAFDMHAPTFRHKMFEAYKGTRKPMPEELREQVPVMKEVLQAMNIVIMEREGLEADDILGTLAKKAQKNGMEVALVSGDRDLLQIADEHIKIRIPKTKMGRTQIEDYYPADVVSAYGVTPLQFIDLKALMGDTADNIPGVPKVGQKTATELMETYGSLEAIYEHVGEISKKSIRESLAANRDLADLSRALATIKTDCEIELDYEAARAEGFYTPQAYTLFKELEFKNMLSRFDTRNSQEVAKDISQTFVRLASQSELLDRLSRVKKGATIGLMLAADADGLVGVSVSVSDSASDSALDQETFCYLLKRAENVQLSLFADPTGGDGDDEEAVRRALRELSARCRVATFDIKKEYDWMSQETTDAYFDILIGAYLINPLKNDYQPESIAAEHLGLSIPSKAELLGKLRDREASAQEPDKLTQYLCFTAYVCRASAAVLEKKLQDMQMEQLMREIEMPLSLVLYDMEKVGVEVRREDLKAYGDALVHRIDELERSIHAQAGVAFNINSPKQLGEILFEKMGLPGGKKTKTGYSTAADVLEKLAEENPIVRDILEYRGLVKLKSTYADGLANYIRDDQRIHTNFNQTITATGRISSTEPTCRTFRCVWS